MALPGSDNSYMVLWCSPREATAGTESNPASYAYLGDWPSRPRLQPLAASAGKRIERLAL
jgi:hypothetical protein